jgi:hypothetical protein
LVVWHLADVAVEGRLSVCISSKRILIWIAIEGAMISLLDIQILRFAAPIPHVLDSRARWLLAPLGRILASLDGLHLSKIVETVDLCTVSSSFRSFSPKSRWNREQNN